jgi:uncharacterized protein
MERLFELEALDPCTPDIRAEMALLHAELERMTARRKLVRYLDPLDVRYRHFEQKPEPNTKAVMFCLMDVSASMGEREKDLAKRFFVLLHLFLSGRYHRVDLVFIRHTHQASEVDEETFFHSRETGGTLVSSALEEMPHRRLALFALGMEHLCRPGVGRRQLCRRFRDCARLLKTR